LVGLCCWFDFDGAIKGCPSLPTAAYTGGNIRDRFLREISTPIVSQAESSQPSPVLPRSAWQNPEVLTKLLLKTKKMLDIAELSTLFD
jgi:hypothetical protein